MATRTTWSQASSSSAGTDPMLPPGPPAAAPGAPGVEAVLAPGDDPLRDQLSALRSLLVLSMLLTRQDDEAGILRLVANAVESFGHCVTERILLDGRWTEVRLPHHELAGPVLTGTALPQEGARFGLQGVPWAWAYSLSSPARPGWLPGGRGGSGTRRDRAVPPAGPGPAGRGGAGQRAPACPRAGSGRAAAGQQPGVAAHDGDPRPADPGSADRGGPGRDRPGRLRPDRLPHGHRGPLRKPAGVGRPGPSRSLP